DRARGTAALTRKDRDVFEAAEGAYSHLAEDRQAEPARLGSLPGDRIETRNVAAQQGPQRQPEQNGIRSQDHDAAGIVQPLTDIEAADGHHRDAYDHGAGERQGGGLARGQPSGRGAEHVSQVGGNNENDRPMTVTS